jgi:hypothetical protein
MGKIDWKLLAVFFFVSTGIILNSYLDKDGHLSPDSAYYLRLAQTLLDGNGFYVTDFFGSESGRTFFSKWPVGYPLMISGVARLTGLGVFWASKLLNITFIIFTLLIFKFIFKENAYVYGMVFLVASSLKIFSFTWSEAVFISGLVWLSISLYKFTQNKKNIWLLNILLSSLFLFLCRYIGAFSVVVISLLSLFYLLKREYKTFLKFIPVAAVTVGFIALYLYNNYSETGHFSGIPRIPAPETDFQLFKSLMKAQIGEDNLVLRPYNKLTFLLTFILMLTPITFLFRDLRRNPQLIEKVIHSKGDIWRYFLFVGIIYWISIVIMRWRFRFDNFGYRLLGPSTFLFLLALISYLEYNYKRTLFKKIKVTFLVIVFLSFICTIILGNIYKFVLKKEPTYIEHLKAIKEKYRYIEKRSMIIFGDWHINYIRPECETAFPSKRETINEFIARAKGTSAQNIYIEIRDDLSIYTFDKSVIEFMGKNSEQNFVKIR